MKTLTQAQIINSEYPIFWSILNHIRKIFSYSLKVYISNTQNPALSLKTGICPITSHTLPLEARINLSHHLQIINNSVKQDWIKAGD